MKNYEIIVTLTALQIAIAIATITMNFPQYQSMIIAGIHKMLCMGVGVFNLNHLEGKILTTDRAKTEMYS